VLWWVAGFLASLCALFGLLLQSWAAAVPVGVVLVGLLFAYQLANPPRALAVVLVLAGALGLPLGAQGIELAIRIYPFDILVAILLVAMLIGVWLDPARWSPRWPLQFAFLLILAYFTASLVLGLVRGNDPRTALGDYRRLAAYPLVLLVFAAAIRKPEDCRLMLKALLVAAYATAGIALVRVVSGTGFAEESLAGTTIRYLSYVEAATAGLGVLVAMGFARMAKGRARMTWYLLTIPPVLAVLVSNYRTAWVALAAGLAIQSFSLGWGRGLRLMAVSIFVLVPVTALVVSGTNVGLFVLDRFNVANLSTSGIWRYFSWISAFKAWMASPVLGTGMGYAHQFESYNIRVGAYTQFSTSSVHNDPLAFLVNTGLVGLVLALVFLVPWSRRALAQARSKEPDASLIGSTALGGLTLMTAVSCLQPFFTTAATIAIAMALVATVLRTPVPKPGRHP
jgi:O-antigen ligase